jgi:electron transport complex protein RnfB
MAAIGENPPVSKAHKALAKTYSSPFLLGPPMSDALIELVRHMYTEDEADIVQYLRPGRARTASHLARSSGRPLPEVEKALHHLAHEMFILLAVGRGRHERFTLMPIVPGTFEAVLMRPSADSVTDWHRRFAELYEALFDTGYMTDYLPSRHQPVRYIPVGEVIDSIPMALPSDRLETILDGFDSYAIAVCQCRLAKQLVGESCGKKLDVCTAFGDISKWLVTNGKARQASKQDVLDTKAEAESQGMVTWMFNVGNNSRLNGSCSCCGCCCGALRSITQFNMPGSIAPPHFMPHFTAETCVACEKCEKICPVKAITIVGESDGKRIVHIPERCIGCGLCAVACSKSSIAMKEVPGYKQPLATWPRFVASSIPEQLQILRRVTSSRKRG